MRLDSGVKLAAIMATAIPSTVDIQAFRSEFHGQVFEPGDSGYDEARQIWNASVSKRPRVIARCSGLADVIAAVNFGRTNDLLRLFVEAGTT
jgi:hypothetical protein